MHLLACQTQSYHSSMFGQTQKDTHELRTPRSSGHLHAISFWSRDISQMCLSWGYFYDRSRYYCAWYLHSESKALKKTLCILIFVSFIIVLQYKTSQLSFSFCSAKILVSSTLWWLYPCLDTRTSTRFTSTLLPTSEWKIFPFLWWQWTQLTTLSVLNLVCILLLYF